MVTIQARPEFAAVHRGYLAAADKVDPARAARDAALAGVGQADGALDGSLDVLGNAMVGAGMGRRQNPFAGFSRYSPSKLQALPLAEEPVQVRALAQAVTVVKPPAAVARAVATCVKNAGAVDLALKRLSAPQAAYTKAMADRDALLPGWMRAYSRLRKHAAALWDEDEALLDATFAPPGAVQRPVKKTKPRPKAPAPAPVG